VYVSEEVVAGQRSPEHEDVVVAAVEVSGEVGLLDGEVDGRGHPIPRPKSPEHWSVVDVGVLEVTGRLVVPGELEDVG
jgi:hypothetical protein